MRRIVTAREQYEMTAPWRVAADSRDLYHRTSPENAAAINQGRSFNPGLEKGQRPDAIFFSTHPGHEPESNTSGYGEGLVHLRVPGHLFDEETGEFNGPNGGWMDDEYPSGEQHWAIPHQHIKPEWFQATHLARMTRKANMNPVTLYTKPGCPQCDMTKKRLEHHEIPYRPVDLSTDPDALHHVINNLGYTSAPVVDAGGGNHWSGFRPDRIKALLG